MYHVYQNQGEGPITLRVTFLDRFYNLPFLKSFRHTFLKNCKGYKVETRYKHRQGADVLCIPESGPWALLLLELHPLTGFTICHK